METLKSRLDNLVERYNIPQFIENDPVQFPRRYSNRQDIEVTAFLIATIAWGNRKMILRSAENMLSIMGKSPFDYVMSQDFGKIETDKSMHRTFFGRDFIYFCKGFNSMYLSHDSLEDVFCKEGNHDVWQGILNFRNEMAKANGHDSRQISNPVHGNSNNGSACKRLHLALRWLVRNDGIVDMGIWNRLKPADLMIPLDTHVASVSRQAGLLTRNSNDRLAVEMLNNELRKFDPSDPVKYDFALFGLGIEMKDNPDTLIQKRKME